MTAMTRPNHKPPLVLLHGWGMNAAVWQGVLPALKEHYALHCLELPGHGKQPFHSDFDLMQLAQDSLRAAPPQAAWLGWSLGGLVSLQAALLQPQRITRLLLVGSNPCFTQRPDWPHAMEQTVLQQFHDALEQDFTSALQRFLSLQVRGSEHGRETLRQLREEVLSQTPDPRALACGLDILRTTDLRDQLPQVSLPVHLIHGARDTLMPLAAARASLPLFTATQVRLHIIPGAGHAPFVSHPQPFADFVHHCLDER